MERFKIGDVDFAADSGELLRGKDVAALEPKPSAVLRMLCLEPGRVVSRRVLLDRCWGEGDGSDEALTQCIAQIRRGFEALGGSAEWIQTRAKVGYRLVAPGPSIESAKPERPAWRRHVLIAGFTTLTAVLALWVAYPHAARHFVRHSLGLHHPG